MRPLEQQPEAAYLRAVTEFLFPCADPMPADILLIPGAVCPELAQRAAELYRAGWARRILVSGRYSITRGSLAEIPPAVMERYPGDYETEADFLSAVLLREGVPDAAILRERMATYTWENAQFSRRMTDDMGLRVDRALLVCKPFHARRALLYYQAAFPETEILPVPASLPGRNRDDWWRTPEGRASIYGELRRLGSQVTEVLEGTIEA